MLDRTQQTSLADKQIQAQQGMAATEQANVLQRMQQQQQYHQGDNLSTDTAQPQPAECRFYCAVGDIDQARTVEAEPVFVADVDDVLDGQVIDCNAVTLPTMGNLPWLVAMARQQLRGDIEWRPGYVVEEVAS